jgi:UDP-N-acetylmuramoyl-L-alanyl-D-glutamate--2,6-diaminopimelate ligase
MRLQELLSGVEILAQSGNPEVSGLEYDSRRIKPGYAFVALRGESVDGNRFIRQALAAGAAAVITDSDERPEPIAWARVRDARRALALLSANFYGHPARQLRIIGITGTNGKTTTSFLVESILRAAGRKAALVGTIEYHVAGKMLPAPHTTPEALELNRLFREALDAGTTDVVMEVSSHALALQRTFGIPFEVAAFTNLTRDHLDYHRTMDEYFRAKRILFAGCGARVPRYSVVNADDPYGRELEGFSEARGTKAFSYGMAEGDFRAAKPEMRPSGTRFELLMPDGSILVRSPLIGRVNVYNMLAASGAAYAGACPKEAIRAGLENLRRVPGRFEPVDCGQPFTVVVDYAHTDDALRNLLVLARDLVARSGGRVITVFGCGGDRDRSKRPLMGEAAGQGSDFVVLTSDNPRSEDPHAIMAETIPGLERTGVQFEAEADRRTAIDRAIRRAHPGDIVVLAGKGHERVQVMGTSNLPFDDRQVAREALRNLGYPGDRADNNQCS